MGASLSRLDETTVIATGATSHRARCRGQHHYTAGPLSLSRPPFYSPRSLPSSSPRHRERESRGTARHHHDSYHDSLFHRPRIAKSFQMLIAPFPRQRSTLQSNRIPRERSFTLRTTDPLPFPFSVFPSKKCHAFWSRLEITGRGRGPSMKTDKELVKRRRDAG